MNSTLERILENEIQRMQVKIDAVDIKNRLSKVTGYDAGYILAFTHERAVYVRIMKLLQEEQKRNRKGLPGILEDMH